ncbi:DUF885 family protein [Planctobacterium marinum]|uniref:DUF885 domain-containing protein n=1 Tax=Planctobacterium marinum TaxID=1631968 RepID=A0AA48KR84_9ALTE|nr:hypothetical protein MACH26_13730 [Planctobacterium marinum]
MNTTPYKQGNVSVHQKHRLLGICLAAIWLLLGCSTQAESNSDIVLKKLERAISETPFLQPRLDFSAWLKDNQSHFNLHATTIMEWHKSLSELQPEDGCEQLRQDNLKTHLNLLHNRVKLMNALPEDTNYSGRMSDLPNGKQWYVHWLNSWLLLDTERSSITSQIEQLKFIAHEELSRAHPQYLALQDRVAKKPPSGFSRSQHDSIVHAFKKTEQQIVNHLEQVFGTLPAIPPVRIKPSNLPKSFPAPGIYNNDNQTFYYHFTDQNFPAESVDWLYLHEALPGHHLQSYVSRQQSFCPVSTFFPLPLVTAEGWAAYVETLGEQLGVFEQASSLHYALEWRVLRALRVLIDIGIHFEGWTDEQALAQWRHYLPDRMSIGRRELARIKRWPVQVITYVYGKHHIETLIQQLLSEYGAEHHATIRNTILRLTNQPLVSLQTASYFLTRTISK